MPQQLASPAKVAVSAVPQLPEQTQLPTKPVESITSDSAIKVELTPVPQDARSVDTLSNEPVDASAFSSAQEASDQSKIETTIPVDHSVLITNIRLWRWLRKLHL
jgi:hypothetical protein